MNATAQATTSALKDAPAKSDNQRLLEQMRAVFPEPTDPMSYAGYRKMVEIHDNSPFDGSPLLGHADKVFFAMLEKAPYSWWKPLVGCAQAELAQENRRLKAYVADMEDTLRQMACSLGMDGAHANADALLARVKKLAANS